MNNQNIQELRLSDLLALAAGDVPDPSVRTGVDSEDLRNLKGRISNLTVPIAWSEVQSNIASVISEELDTSVLELWAQCWEKYKALMDDAERSRKSPRAVVTSKLATHSIESTLRPYLDIFLGPKKIQRIPFEVTLTTNIGALELVLRNGRITALQLGEVEWTGKIAVGKIMLVNPPLAKLVFSGRIELKNGIALGRSDGD
jgi:hypothetical protein